jgi:hypothetical protein
MGSLSSLLTKKQDKNMNEDIEKQENTEKHLLDKLPIGDVISRFNSDTFIDNVCLSYRHDFGLMAEQDRQRLRFECKEWMRAISNNWEYFKNGL